MSPRFERRSGGPSREEGPEGPTAQGTVDRPVVVRPVVVHQAVGTVQAVVRSTAALILIGRLTANRTNAPVRVGRASTPSTFIHTVFW